MRNHPKPIRISIVTAVAALSILSLGQVTSVATALPKQKGTAAQCAIRQENWEAEIREGEKAHREGHYAEAAVWFSVAEEEKANAKALGCGWAASEPAPGQPNQERPSTKGLAP